MSSEKRYKWRREDYRENTKGLLMVNTGDGKGKTTAAIGLMVRAAGRGLNCCMIQFMKSKTDRYGEHESLEKLGIEIHTMGDGFTWDTNDKTQDIKTSEETWALCAEKMRSEEYDLLVFDELVYVLDYKFQDDNANRMPAWIQERNGSHPKPLMLALKPRARSATRDEIAR